MFFKAAACVLSMLAVGSFATPAGLSKRDSTNVTIYAYGTEISGLPVYAGPNGNPITPPGLRISVDYSYSARQSLTNTGTAYIAESHLSTLSSLSWAIGSSSDTPWNVTLNTTIASAPEAEFYIVTSDDAYEAAGFLSPNGTLPTGAETVGFTTYGSFIMFADDDSILSQFWAQGTDTDGLWTLMWNSNGASQNNSVPVTLKTTAPSSS